MAQPSSFLNGLNAGSNLVGDIISDQQKRQAMAEQTRQFDVTAAQRQKELAESIRQFDVADTRAKDFHNDTMEIERRRSELESERNKIFQTQAETQKKATDAKIYLDALRENQHADGMTKLGDLAVKLQDIYNGPSDAMTPAKITETWKPYLGLLAHSSPEVVNYAQSLNAQSQAFVRTLGGWNDAAEMTGLKKEGWVPQEAQGIEALYEGRRLKMRSTIRSEAAAAGVDNMSDEDVESALQPSDNREGYTPASVATLRRKIQLQAQNAADTASVARKKAALSQEEYSDKATSHMVLDEKSGKGIDMPLAEAMNSPTFRPYAMRAIGNIPVRYPDGTTGWWPDGMPLETGVTKIPWNGQGGTVRFQK